MEKIDLASQVGNWAQLVDKYGASMVISIVLGIVFLTMLYSLLKGNQKQNQQFYENNQNQNEALDKERRELMHKVIQIIETTNDSMHGMSESIKQSSSSNLETVRHMMDSHDTFFKETEKTLSVVIKLAEAAANNGIVVMNEISDVKERLEKIEV